MNRAEQRWGFPESPGLNPVGAIVYAMLVQIVLGLVVGGMTYLFGG